MENAAKLAKSIPAIILLFLIFGCLTQVQPKDAKLQLVDLLTKAQSTPWAGAYDVGYGKYTGPAYREYYLNQTDYRVDGMAATRPFRFIRRGGLGFECFLDPSGWTCRGMSTPGYSGLDLPFQANQLGIENISGEKITAIAPQEIAGTNASCYKIDTTDILLPDLNAIDKFAGEKYWTIYCFSVEGVLLKEEKRFIEHSRYGAFSHTNVRYVSSYSLNVSEKDLELPEPLGDGAAPVPDSVAPNQTLAQTTLPTPHFDDYCPVEGWAILSVGESVKLGNWTARFADVGTAVGSDNQHPAILDVLDENGKMLEQVRVNPGEPYTVRRESDGRSIVIKVNMTATGLTLSAKWIAIWGRASDCKDEMLNLETGQKMVPSIQRWLLHENDTIEISGTRVQYAGTRINSPIEGVYNYYVQLQIQNGSSVWQNVELGDKEQARLRTANGSVYQLIVCEMSRIANTPNRPWMIAAYQPNDAYTPAPEGICTPLDILKNEKMSWAINLIPYEEWMPEAREGDGYAILNHGESIRYGNLMLMFAGLLNRGVFNVSKIGDAVHAAHVIVYDQQGRVLFYDAVPQGGQVKFDNPSNRQTYAINVYALAAGVTLSAEWTEVKIKQNGADASALATTERIENGTMNGQAMDSQIMRDYAAGSLAGTYLTLKAGDTFQFGYYTMLFDGTIRKDDEGYSFAAGINNGQGVYGGRLQIFDEKKHKVFDGYMWEGTERLLGLSNGLFQFKTYEVPQTGTLSSRTISLNITMLGEFSPHARLLFILESEGWNRLSRGEKTEVQALQIRCTYTPCETSGSVLKITQNAYWETDIPIQYRAIKLDITTPDGRTSQLKLMPNTYVDWAAPDGKTYEIQVQEPTGSERQSVVLLKVLQVDADTSYQGAECAGWNTGSGRACRYLKDNRMADENFRPRSQDNITIDGLEIKTPYGWSRDSVYVEVRNPNGPDLGGWVNLGQGITVKSTMSGKSYEVRLLATDQYRTLAAEEHEYGSDVFAATIGVRPVG